MLYAAAAWRPGEARPPAEELLAEPQISVYVEGWGRQGDSGVIAEDVSHSPLGAAWYRVFSQQEHGYGFVRPDIPEVTIGVSPTARGKGIGTALLDALIARADAEGLRGLSLSVEEDNPAVSLYERAGFVRDKRVGNAWTMLRFTNRFAKRS
jgi:ribosomal protein S18 acetylase RimI-like enzyme